MQDSFQIAAEVQRHAPIGMIFRVPKKYVTPENYQLIKGQRLCRVLHETLFLTLTKAGYQLKHKKRHFKLPNLCSQKNENFIIKVI